MAKKKENVEEFIITDSNNELIITGQNGDGEE
jgi:hypothetical protein